MLFLYLKRNSRIWDAQYTLIEFPISLYNAFIPLDGVTISKSNGNPIKLATSRGVKKRIFPCDIISGDKIGNIFLLSSENELELSKSKDPAPLALIE